MIVLLSLLIADDSVDARRVRIIARALSYELNLKQRTQGDAVDVLIVSKPGDAACNLVFDAFNQLGGVRVQGIPLRLKRRELASSDAVAAELRAAPVQVLYLCASLNQELSALLPTTRKLHVLSVTGGKKQVEAGASVGVEVDGDRITLMVNSAAAKAEGANFSDQLLKVATVID